MSGDISLSAVAQMVLTALLSGVTGLLAAWGKIARLEHSHRNEKARADGMVAQLQKQQDAHADLRVEMARDYATHQHIREVREEVRQLRDHVDRIPEEVEARLSRMLAFLRQPTRRDGE